MKRFITFLGVGGASTLIQFLLLWLIIQLNLTNEVVASASSYGLAAMFNYLVNYRYTYTSNKSHGETLPKFLITVALGLGLSTLLFSLFFYGLPKLLLMENYRYLVAQFLATGITVVFNFLIHKFWIYKGH